MIRKFFIMEHIYVFLAIEFGNPYNEDETRVLGVYTTRATAEAKVRKVMQQRGHSCMPMDFGVIKKTIQGRRF